MANTLRAGEKYHLKPLKIRKDDSGKLKAKVVKMKIADKVYDANWQMCGGNYDGEDLNWWLYIKKEYPDSICKKCDSKLRKLIAEA
jgi:hypothetical protein